VFQPGDWLARWAVPLGSSLLHALELLLYFTQTQAASSGTVAAAAKVKLTGLTQKMQVDPAF
jgi:hypothetical protein